MKKEMNDIKVRMVRMEGDIAPFVEIAYVDKYAQDHTGLMLLDSGSTVNILSNEIADNIGELCKIDDMATAISSIAHGIMNTDNVRFSFALGGKLFNDTFCISTKPLPIHVKGMAIIGILGIQFLQRHRLVIDYDEFTLHTSDVSPNNLSVSDCDFFFPMEIGLKFYGVPVLSVKQNGKELVTLVDTGATGNMMAEQALVDNKFKCYRFKGNDVMIGVTGEVDVEEAYVRFNMVSLDCDDVCEISHCDYFWLLPYNVFTPKEGVCDTNGEQLPPIEVLIGSPFMAKEGWVLDFGACIIYKLKDENDFREAV